MVLRFDNPGLKKMSSYLMMLASHLGEIMSRSDHKVAVDIIYCQVL